MSTPADCTVITPAQIQVTNTTTPNGVSTSVLVLGDDDNLYFTQITVPTLNPAQLSIQPWSRLAPIVVPNDFADYPYPSGSGGNVINVPYQTFKIQGQS